MSEALAEARAAAAHDDVPIGAVVVRTGGTAAADGTVRPAGPDGTVGPRIIGRGHNRREVDGDPTAHAEILALREAAATVGSWRLDGCTLYVTLEPCVMCAGALVLARLDGVVFGADDPKAGAVGALYDVPRDPRLNHNLAVVRGVQAEACGDLLRDFFRARRRPRSSR